MNVDNESECIDVICHRLCFHQLSCVAEDGSTLVCHSQFCQMNEGVLSVGVRMVVRVYVANNLVLVVVVVLVLVFVSSCHLAFMACQLWVVRRWASASSQSFLPPGGYLDLFLATKSRGSRSSAGVNFVRRLMARRKDARFGL